LNGRIGELKFATEFMRRRQSRAASQTEMIEITSHDFRDDIIALSKLTGCGLAAWLG
jgi:hypothetical protein